MKPVLVFVSRMQYEFVGFSRSAFNLARIPYLTPELIELRKCSTSLLIRVLLGIVQITLPIVENRDSISRDALPPRIGRTFRFRVTSEVELFLPRALVGGLQNNPTTQYSMPKPNKFINMLMQILAQF